MTTSSVADPEFFKLADDNLSAAIANIYRCINNKLMTV